MFDKLKAAAGVAGLLADLPRIQAKFVETKEQLGRIQCTGHSRCRRVRAVMNGRIELIAVDIDPDAAAAGEPAARAALQSAVAEAINDAIAPARREAARRGADAAREVGLPIPPQLLAQLH
jgi:DNA-binding protein YbaB